MPVHETNAGTQTKKHLFAEVDPVEAQDVQHRTSDAVVGLYRFETGKRF
jgi:hypothetical protein